MSLNINQFAQTTVIGQLDLEFHGSVISGQVSSSQSSALVAGQPVKVENSVGGVPKLLALAAQTDPVHGFVVRNLKDQNFPTLARCEMAMKNSVMFMAASAAIARLGAVEVDYTTVGNVNPAAGINPVIGFAMDEAVNVGDLIRVYIDVPSLGASTKTFSRTVNITATLAQINAGLVLIPGVTGQKITVSNYVARVTGAFASGTSVELESTNASPVAVTTLAEAGLTNGAVLLPSSSNTTLGAGFGAAMGSGDGLQVVNNGSAQTGGTSIQFTIDYTQG